MRMEYDSSNGIPSLRNDPGFRVAAVSQHSNSSAGTGFADE